jgi:hypothetical protein
MPQIFSQREPDGSVHYSHCYSEELPTHPCFERRLRARLVHPTRPLRRTRLFGAALALAGAMFWATMLTSPPTSEAGLSAPASSSCIETGRMVGQYFETELPRRAWARSGNNEFNEMLAGFNAATNQCAAGMVQQSAETFRLVESQIASLDERRVARTEGE